MTAARHEPEVELRVLWMRLHAKGNVATIIGWALSFLLVVAGIAVLAWAASRFQLPNVAVASFG